MLSMAYGNQDGFCNENIVLLQWYNVSKGVTIKFFKVYIKLSPITKI